MWVGKEISGWKHNLRFTLGVVYVLMSDTDLVINDAVIVIPLQVLLQRNFAELVTRKWP